MIYICNHSTSIYYFSCLFLYYLVGDGRMDSPGHCAQSCTYTFMENSSKKILAISTLDKREADKKSVNLEKAGFIRGLKEIQEQDFNVTEVVTDAHLQIGAVMSMLNYWNRISHVVFMCKILCKT